MQNDILVFGAANVDFIIKSEKLPQRGEEIGGGKFMQTVGGKGVNQSIAIARAGGNASFIGSVGGDIYSDKIVLGLMEAGVNTSNILFSSDLASGIALIMVGKEGGNMISLAEGANAYFSAEKVRDLNENLFKNAKMALVQMSIPLESVINIIERCYQYNLPVVVNLAPVHKLSYEIFQKIHTLVINEAECEILTSVYPENEEKTAIAKKKLQSLGIKQAIINLGKKGSYFYNEEESLNIDTYPVKAVDATSAGDSFIGYYMTRLCEDASYEEAIRYGNASGALAVTKFGTQDTIPYKSDVNKLIEDHKL